jgi:hypothetical protein
MCFIQTVSCSILFDLIKKARHKKNRYLRDNGFYGGDGGRTRVLRGQE